MSRPAARPTAVRWTGSQAGHARTEVWTRLEQIAAHAGAVDELLADTHAPWTAGRVWWRSWLEAFEDVRPWVLARWAPDGRLAALAPLARRRRSGWTEIVMLGDGVSDYTRLPARTGADALEVAAALAGHLQRLQGPWSLSLRQLPPHDPVATSLAAQLRHARLISGYSSPRTAITEREVSHYFSRNHRKTARNRHNRLEREGHRPRFEILTEPGAVEAATDEVVAVCRAREHEKLGHSPLDDPRRERFLRSVLSSAAQRSGLELALLRADGVIIAYSVNLVEAGMYRTWNAHYLPAWADYSPGQVLDYLMVERVLDDERYDTIDWMMGMEPYKLRLATHTVPAADLLAWSTPPMVAPVAARLVRHWLEVTGEHDERAQRILTRLRDLRDRARETRA